MMRLQFERIKTMTETAEAPIEIVGCSLYSATQVAGLDGSGFGVEFGPGGSITVTSDAGDAGIRLSKGARIRALDGGGFVIEYLPDAGREGAAGSRP